jgi:hypothetical protein
MSKDIRKVLKRATKAVESSEVELPVRSKPLPSEGNVLEVQEPEAEVTSTKDLKRKASEFVEMEITGSKGKKYKVAVPSSYAKLVPKQWEWTPERYRVAEDIAAGLPMVQVAEINGFHRSTIYGWLEHPEFREHVDGLVLESGMASRRERIATLNRLSDMLIRKVANELSAIKLNEKSIGAVLSTIGQYAKHLAQEKEEFVEASKVEQQTTLNGTLGVAHVNIDKALDSVASEERQKLEEEFNKMADDIIRGLTGEK